MGTLYFSWFRIIECYKELLVKYFMKINKFKFLLVNQVILIIEQQTLVYYPFPGKIMYLNRFSTLL